MKKIYFIIFMAVLPIMLWAQVPSATNFENWHNGMSVVYTQMQLGAHPGPAGANLIWDFSAFSDTLSPVTTTADSFNYHDQTNYPPTQHTWCLYTTDSVNFPYVYFYKSGASSYIVGNINYEGVAGMVNFYYPYGGTWSYAKTPMNYGDEPTDSVTRWYYLPGDTVKGFGLDTILGDAWGKIILPGGITHNRTLRVKTSRYYTDTTTLGVLHSSQTTYAWYDSAHAYPLLRMDSIVTPLGTTRHILFSDIGAGINHLSQSQVSANIFPNPNNGNFTLNYNLSSPKAILNVRDITGRLVYSQNINGMSGKETIDVSSLSQGIYYWELSAVNEISAIGKLSVIK
jgi:hypothetical protein